MIKYRIKTNNKPGVVSVKLNTDTSLEIRGVDRYNTKRVFFKREILDKGTDMYNFGVPLSSKFIDVIIKESIPSKEKGFKILDVKYNKLIREPVYVDSLTAKFLQFAKDFSYNASIYKPGIYVDKTKVFRIILLPTINGTPARINIFTNTIELSKEAIDQDTVSGINWLLIHEFAHNYISNDPDSEYEADFHANILFLAQGYPAIESFNMVASFSDSELNGYRLDQTAEMLDDFEEKIYLNANKLGFAVSGRSTT